MGVEYWNEAKRAYERRPQPRVSATSGPGPIFDRSGKLIAQNPKGYGDRPLHESDQYCPKCMRHLGQCNRCEPLDMGGGECPCCGEVLVPQPYRPPNWLRCFWGVIVFLLMIVVPFAAMNLEYIVPPAFSKGWGLSACIAEVGLMVIFLSLWLDNKQ